MREAQDRDEEHQVTIASLGIDLNQALAQGVDELSQYRSDFFDRVRQAFKSVLGIKIKGDRFVFGSELLFPTASAELNEVGQRELANLSEVIRDTVDRLPDNVDWNLGINGTPISDPSVPQFLAVIGSRPSLNMVTAK